MDKEQNAKRDFNPLNVKNSNKHKHKTHFFFSRNGGKGKHFCIDHEGKKERKILRCKYV